MISFGLRPSTMFTLRRWWRGGGWWLASCYAVLGLAVFGDAAWGQGAARIVSVGGAVTEIVYRLGAGDQLVGVDTSSIYPEAATELPQVGYQRRLSVEGVLSLNPTLILLSVEAGPPDAVALLKSAGVRMVHVPAEHTVAGAQEKIRVTARALDREAEGEAMVNAISSDIEAVRERLRSIAAKPKVLFIYARGQGAMSVSGTQTSADAMIALAGGVNAVTGYEGFKPLTSEALVAAAPDWVLIPERGLESVGGLERLLQVPGLALTPAGQARRVVAMDDLYLLGFGPRVGQAVTTLAQHLHARAPIR